MGSWSDSDVVLAEVDVVEGNTEVVVDGVVMRVVVTADVVGVGVVGDVDEGPAAVVSPTSAAAAASQSAANRVADSPWGVATAEP